MRSSFPSKTWEISHPKTSVVGGFQPIWKILVKLDHFPRTCLISQPRNTPLKFNSEFTPEKLPGPNGKPDRLPTTIFQGRAVKLRWGYVVCFLKWCLPNRSTRNWICNFQNSHGKNALTFQVTWLTPRDASPWFRWSHCISNKYKAEFCVGLVWRKKNGLHNMSPSGCHTNPNHVSFTLNFRGVFVADVWRTSTTMYYILGRFFELHGTWFLNVKMFVKNVEHLLNGEKKYHN